MCVSHIVVEIDTLSFSETSTTSSQPCHQVVVFPLFLRDTLGSNPYPESKFSNGFCIVFFNVSRKIPRFYCRFRLLLIPDHLLSVPVFLATLQALSNLPAASLNIE